MIAAINRRIDDIIPQTDAIEYLNAGLHEMEIVANASFPELTGTSTDTFVFPEKYHNVPVMYAVAKYLQSNLLLQQAQVFMQEYQQQLMYFAERYTVPPQYWDTDTSQQFVAQDGQSAFVITNNSYTPQSGRLKVFLNNVQTTDFQTPSLMVTSPSTVVTTLTTTNDPSGFVFNPTTPISAGYNVTAQWEVHDVFDEPPYEFWTW